MKKILTLVLCSLFATASFSQSDFYFDADTIFHPVLDAMQFETPADNHVTNTSDKALDFNWTRTVNDFYGNDITSSFCIRDLCFPAATSSGSFTIEKDEKAVISCHIWNPNQIVNANAEVVVEVTLAGDPSQSKRLVFLFGELATDTDEAVTALTTFFPNPTTEYFQLENSDWVNTIQVMDVQGRLVKTFSATPGGSYDVSGLTLGSYFAVLTDKDGDVGRTVRFEKK